MYRTVKFAIVAITSALVAMGSAQAETEVIADGLKFPEGPLLIDGKPHWVEYAGNTVMRLDGDKKTVVHSQEGCGHNGLARAPGNQLAVICYESGEVLYIDYDGKVVERLGKDSNGQPLDHPNDIAFDSKGGAYLTTSGPFVANPKIVGVFSTVRRALRRLPKWQTIFIFRMG